MYTHFLVPGHQTLLVLNSLTLPFIYFILYIFILSLLLLSSVLWFMFFLFLFCMLTWVFSPDHMASTPPYSRYIHNLSVCLDLISSPSQMLTRHLYLGTSCAPECKSASKTDRTQLCHAIHSSKSHL